MTDTRDGSALRRQPPSASPALTTMHRTIFSTPVVNTALRGLSLAYLRLKGWIVEGSLPAHAEKCVLIAAPHTSNWDLPYTLMVAARAANRQGGKPTFITSPKAQACPSSWPTSTTPKTRRPGPHPHAQRRRAKRHGNREGLLCEHPGQARQAC